MIQNYSVKNTAFLILGFCLLLTTGVFSQNDTCAEFQSLVNKTYDFKPSKVSRTEIDTKSDEMDVIWKKATSEKDVLLPCLKKAIAQPNANNFFVFDGSNLLFKLEPSDNSKRILVKAYAQVDLEDVDQAYWIRYVALLGFEGFDTTSAGQNWMAATDPGYYLPQHGVRRVTKNIGALIIYGSMDEKFAAPALTAFVSQKDGQHSELAISLLLNLATDDSVKALQNLDKTKLSELLVKKISSGLSEPRVIVPRVGSPKTTREQYLMALTDVAAGDAGKFMKLAIEIPDGDSDLAAVFGSEDIPLVRKARRYFAATATPHSPEWYDSFTQIINTLKSKIEKPKK